MTDGKKKRLSMLDSLAAAGAPMATPSMMVTNRALRSARDAVDSHRIWELDPALVDDTRFRDRLDPGDVLDLRASIEANGQTVPILVRRAPGEAERYLLVYGRRRLEAIRGSDKVTKVRALIASMDEDAAIRAQVSENTARRDLSYIERALFARELLDSGFGNQSQIAEVLNTTKSAISMALTVANGIGTDLARAIGPAHGIGRPRWEALAQDIATSGENIAPLILAAHTAHAEAQLVEGDAAPDASMLAFQAVTKLIARDQQPEAKAPPAPSAPAPRRLTLAGKPAGQVSRSPKGLRIELSVQESDFLAWVESQAQEVIEELHARWQRGA
ncbi:plasmid partitioning protein RepB [Pseudogemmobacter bohemicus]|uniref:plasmid partitioning protein RepB n=1 Tax=Pseudogemmobacter bohemicus TaxID=2250708 RepID=UPI000DD4492C|nr:plasmid partitioning protein RepB [Pseudogemmobacter bohemicus]